MDTVAVIFGGQSTEHDVSVITALSSIIKPLELSQKYRVEAIYVAKSGAWYWDKRLKDINLFTSGRIESLINQKDPIGLTFGQGLTIFNTNRLTKRRIKQKIDLVFPAMHGTYGEDGSLMGFLEMAKIPYVGCGLSASVVAMDKVLTKQVMLANDIPVTKFLNFSDTEIDHKLNNLTSIISQTLAYPLFVKPAHLGSSIGISRATDEKSLRDGLEVAAHYDNKVIVEEAVHNLIEVTLPILGNDTPMPALLEQPLTNNQNFFDFETKYMRGGKKGKTGKSSQGYSQLPAELPKALYQKAELLGLEVYKVLGCSGIARVDMLIDAQTNKVFVNEVNPLPGSLSAHNWSKAGVSNIELVDKLITFAKDRYSQRQKLVTSFETNYLKQF